MREPRAALRAAAREGARQWWTPIPPFERRTLANGMTLLLIEKKGVPLVSMELVIGTGAVADPTGHEGRAWLAFALLRKGTLRRTSSEFAAAVDSLGGLFGAAIDHDHGHVSAEFLSRDVGAGLDLMAEAVAAPAFAEAEVAKRTQQAIDGIASDKDYPPAVLGRYFDAMLFAGHPYGRSVGGDEASLSRVTRDEIAAFHAEAFDPRRALLILAGEFDPDTATRDAERAFGAMRARTNGDGDGAAALADPQPVRGRRVTLIDKPDEASCYFRFGNVGIAFKDPEWPAILLACTVLGGQFTSWLNQALRVDGGLTYGVSASCARRRRRGSFAISSFTPVEHAERAIAVALEQLARIHDEGVDAPTLSLAKNYVRGQFPLSIETADQIADTIARVEAHGLDRAYIDTYLDRIERATPESVTDAARRVFPRDDLAFAIIGPAEALLPVAQALGPVTKKSIGEPGF